VQRILKSSLHAHAHNRAASPSLKERKNKTFSSIDATILKRKNNSTKTKNNLTSADQETLSSACISKTFFVVAPRI
jgi:deoxyribose-phosphate aldolase